MRIYFDCSMGASGDMLMAALYELLPDKSAFHQKMEWLTPHGVTLEFSDSVKCGIKGTHITVRVSGVEETSEDVFLVGQDHNNHAHTHAHDNAHAHSHDQNHHSHHSHTHDHHTHNQNQHNHDNHNHDHMHSNSHGHNHHNETNLNHNHGNGSGGHRYGFSEILELIRGLDLPRGIIDDALGVYRILGEAEASVHGVSLEEVHLHEIGSLDAVADIVGCCLLINMIGAAEIAASPVHVGSGFIKCEHGVLPVPAPAAAEILKGIPIYGGQIRGELCTPTGAALLKRFVTRFGDMTPMTTTKIGYGMGAKDFEIANCLRAFLCEQEVSGSEDHDSVFEISCNLDDMTPEAVGAAFGTLFENGALDVYTTPITMKKNRPAIILSCMCAEEKLSDLTRLMLEHTSTLGVRISAYRREILSRTVETYSTGYGDIRIKRAEGHGVLKYKPEYDDVLSSAKRHDVPFMTVYNAAMRAARHGVHGAERGKRKAPPVSSS